MITQEQIKSLKSGDKLIFITHSGVLSGRPFEVWTFAKWKDEFDGVDGVGSRFWQSQELLDLGNYQHNFSIWSVEVFDKDIHKPRFITKKELISAESEFNKQFYGQ